VGGQLVERIEYDFEITAGQTHCDRILFIKKTKCLRDVEVLVTELRCHVGNIVVRNSD
jgi:hypothetical protein